MRFLIFLLPALLLAAETTPAHKKGAPGAPAAAATAGVANYKISGSPAAPITIEIYTDYECPACRALYLDTLPSLNAEFVKTGKVRLIHRDFPLPQHQFSKLATRYANAAGVLGKYDLVANQIFQSQPLWDQNGNVDAEVAKVLSPAEMEKVRVLVRTDQHLDDSVTKDVSMGQNDDRITQTPTIEIVYKGKREQIAGGMPYAILKSYLNKKLSE